MNMIFVLLAYLDNSKNLRRSSRSFQAKPYQQKCIKLQILIQESALQQTLIDIFGSRDNHSTSS